MNNNNKVLFALLGGAILGVAIGILFAPDKGSETRRKISDAANDLSDKAKTFREKMKVSKDIDETEDELYGVAS